MKDGAKVADYFPLDIIEAETKPAAKLISEAASHTTPIEKKSIPVKSKPEVKLELPPAEESEDLF